MYLKGDYKLIAKYNRFDECVQIADLDTPDLGWTDYDPTQGDLFPLSFAIIKVVKQTSYVQRQTSTNLRRKSPSKSISNERPNRSSST